VSTLTIKHPAPPEKSHATKRKTDVIPNKINLCLQKLKAEVQEILRRVRSFYLLNHSVLKIINIFKIAHNQLI